VPAYRIYELHARRRVMRPARVLICENDTDVIRMVEPPADGHDVEIMEGARVVAFDLPRSDNLAVASRQQLRNCGSECIEALKGDWPRGTRAPRRV
jgi:hypothetical protein